MSDQSKIKKTIAALLAKAKGTDNEAEASAFLAKAMDMLQAHQLDVCDLVDEGDPILKHVGLSRAKSGHAWRWKLYSKVAQLYGCKSIHIECYLKDEQGVYKRDRDGNVIPGYEQTLVGRESAIITTDLMYPWIVEQVRSKAREIAKETGMSEQGQAKRVAAALITRIARLIAEQRDTKPTTPAGRNALVVMDQVSAQYEAMFPDTSLIKAKRARTDALSRDAANSIGLNRQTSGKSQFKIGAR